MLFGQPRERIERLLADHHQLAFEGVAVGAIGAAPDDALAHDRHGIDHRLAQPVERGGNIAPAQHALAFLDDEFFQLIDHEGGRLALARQEALRHAVFAGRRQVDAFAFSPVAEQGIGDLQQDARAIAKQRIGANRAAMVEIAENFQRPGYDRMAFVATDMRDHADAAGVVLIAWIVEPAGGRVGR